jgi:hypothetical protein
VSGAGFGADSEAAAATRVEVASVEIGTTLGLAGRRDTTNPPVARANMTAKKLCRILITNVCPLVVCPPQKRTPGWWIRRNSTYQPIDLGFGILSYWQSSLRAKP